MGGDLQQATLRAPSPISECEVPRSLGIEWIESLPERLPDDLAAALPASLAHGLCCIPIAIREGHLVLATGAPAELLLKQERVEFQLGMRIRIVATPVLEAMRLVEIHHPRLNQLIELAKRDLQRSRQRQKQTAPGKFQATLPAVVELCDYLLRQATAHRASDLHVEPAARNYHLRLRIDGTMKALPSIGERMGRALVARLKLLAGMELGKPRQAQDGRFSWNGIDHRLAVVPTPHGESAVVRLLNLADAPATLEELGIPQACQEQIEGCLTANAGLLLCTGPTGSGKTTTLHTILKTLSTSGRKILTAEDPIEYHLEEAVQLQVQPQLGLGFAEALKSFLRHDPDVILVGEIRDRETATVAAHAALTGHLVLASLHAPSACLTPLRLLELGLEPWLVADALELVIAQRLLRRTCQACSGTSVHCTTCQGTGFNRRFALFEWLRITEAVREAISLGKVNFTPEILAGACSPNLTAAGTAAVLAGQTIEEELYLELRR